MQVAVIDLETELTAPGYRAPRIACCTISIDGNAPSVIHGQDSNLPALLDKVFNECPLIVGHGFSYDSGVFIGQHPELTTSIFRAFAENRVTDTLTRQKLIDIATGTKYAKVRGKLTELYHGLNECVGRFWGQSISGKDDLRLNYGKLVDVPLSDWPDATLQYAIDDVVWTFNLWSRQQAIDFAPYLEDQFNQARATLWLQLMSNHGMKVCPDRLELLSQRNEETWRELATELYREHGLCKIGGTKKKPKLVKNTKKAKARLRASWDTEAHGPLPITVTGKKKEKKEGIDPRATDTYLSLAYEDCLKTKDDALICYANFSKSAYRKSTEIPRLSNGGSHIIHSRYGLVDTGRSNSSNPNSQNFPRRNKRLDLPHPIDGVPLGVRECVVARDGYVFADSDYGRLELCTLAQVQLNLFGRSRLADVLNGGTDPHTQLAAIIDGCSYAQFQSKLDAGDKVAKNLRNTAKVANFGFPGGLGATSFVNFALSSYGVVVTLQQAKELKRFWTQAWPEMSEYFDYISALVGGFGGKGTIKHHYSNRYRGRVGFTNACNSPFQGLGADATKRAGFLLALAMWVDLASPLFGCRMANYIHDQFLTEVPIERAHECALEQERLMIVGAQPLLPDITIQVDTVLSRYWSKDAERLVDSNGRLIPWPRMAA